MRPQQLYYNFKLYWKTLEKDCIHWEQTDSLELEIQCKDGANYIYNDIDHSIRKKIDTSTDEGWRKEFARRLRKKIAMKNISLVQLSLQTGVSQPLLSLYAVGKTLPSAQKVSSLAKALDCSVDELIGF